MLFDTMDSLYFPIIDNGMNLSRTRWAASMFCAGVSGVLNGRRVIVQTISHPDPSAAMNMATADFEESGADRMIVIDTDEIFVASDLAILISHHLSFVSGLYPKKTARLEFPIIPLNGESCAQLLDKSAESPVEVRCVPRGFLNVHRSVFELLKPYVPTCTDPDNGKSISLYWRSIPGGISEDFAFCELYRKHGGRVWLDHRIRVRHEGTMIFPMESSL